MTYVPSPLLVTGKSDPADTQGDRTTQEQEHHMGIYIYIYIIIKRLFLKNWLISCWDWQVRNM